VEVLQRIQPLDILLAILWAAIVGWGLQAGSVRQLGMLVGVYGAALVSGSAYRQGGAALALAFGRDIQPQLEFIAYTALFIIVFGVVTVVLIRAYPSSRFKRGFGWDNVAGAVLGAIWGVLLLIALVTILRYYAVVPWQGQETAQQGVAHEIQLSQVEPALEVVTSPLWQVMVPWFPVPVSAHL
jgi:uncharacterized membrane protein required for colicin V production